MLDNKGCSFHPHIALVRTGQPFVIKNSDQIGHNTNATLHEERATSIARSQRARDKQMTFAKSEAMPLPVNCSIHPFMHGFLLVKDDPYMAVSGEDGTFEIKNIPAGKQEFVVLAGSARLLEEIEVQGRRDESTGPGRVDDRRRQDARPGRDQSAGERVAVTDPVRVGANYAGLMPRR